MQISSFSCSLPHFKQKGKLKIKAVHCNKEKPSKQAESYICIIKKMMMCSMRLHCQVLSTPPPSDDRRAINKSLGCSHWLRLQLLWPWEGPPVLLLGHKVGLLHAATLQLSPHDLRIAIFFCERSILSMVFKNTKVKKQMVV